MARPVHKVYVDDGTGTYPIDISSRVWLTPGVSLSGFGRSDTFSQAQASTFTVTLRNNDGGLTIGSGGWDTTGWDQSPWGGTSPIYPGQGIRWTLTVGATTVTRFTGRITAVNLGWQGGPAKMSTVVVTAADMLASLSRRTLRSMLEEEILHRNPSAYYTLGEAEASTSAGDSSGNQAAPLTIAGSGNPVTFGSGTGPGTDGLTAAQFAGGQYLYAPLSPPASGAVSMWFNTSTVPSGRAYLFGGSLELFITSLGKLATGGLASAQSVTDGLTHHAVLTVTSGTSASLYLDGALVGSVVTSTSINPQITIGSGPYNDPFVGDPAFTGTISHVAVYPTVLSGSDVTSIYGAGVGVVDSTATRFSRICNYVGINYAFTAGMSGRLIGAQRTSGVSAFDALQAVASAEGGVAYADGSGLPTLQGGGYRANKLAPTLTVSSKEVSPDASPVYDHEQIINQVTATRTDGATQYVQSPASVTTYGAYPQSFELTLLSDSDVLTTAQWVVAKFATPAPRVATLTTENLMTSPNAEAILALKVGDRITLTGMPTQLWAGATDFVIEGWTESASDSAWSITFNVVAWSIYQSAIYDNATYGLYDTTLAVYAQ